MSAFPTSPPTAVQVFGVEYLGTTQIVTLVTPCGRVKARLSSDITVRVGERVGLTFRPEKLSIFEKSTGRAIRTALHDQAIQKRETVHG